MTDELKEAVKKASQNLFGIDVEPELSRPEEQFGDYSTNVALQLAAQLDKSPREIAEQLANKLQTVTGVAKIEVAGPGFINFTLTDEALWQMLSAKPAKPLSGQEILVEFGDPNPFKEMHIGHLYSYVIGDAISGLLEANGAQVRRLSYHGDVGLQIAKTIWAIKKRLDSTAGLQLADVFETDAMVGSFYAEGSKAFEDDSAAKEEILDINEHIYAKDDPEINKIYETGRQLSFEAFDRILNLLSIRYDKRYLESQTVPLGKELVEKNIGRVFKQSQGAVVFEGEKAGLHTRVFITSKGLPTYETKDLGLVVLKDKDYPDAGRSIVITANEQAEYFKVMLAALAEINADLVKKTTHLSHGFLSLTTGKMSSRAGNIYAAMDLLLAVKDAVHEQYPDSLAKKEVTFGAVKYAFLKHRLGSDIVFDIKESISLEGNSGPYLQYAHARASNILAKSQAGEPEPQDFDPSERSLARKLSEYPEVVAKAAAELMPHHVANYLYELAQAFNRFYEVSRVVGDPREALRLQLVKIYRDILADGLKLLNIEPPEKM